MSKAAKIAYQPWGIASSLIGGLVAGQFFKQAWKYATPGDKDAPGPLETEYDLKEIFIAAAMQGAIFAVVKTAINRKGAALFQRWTGEWPGD